MGKARGGEDALPDRIVRVTGGSQISYGGGVSKHSTNNVISSSYTLWNFLPFNLILQFSNMSNLYFLFVGALQIIPAITTTDGNPTMYQPLAFIVMVSAIRAASEDYQKHKADAKRNGYLYEVLQGDGSFQKTKSGHLVVGNVIKVMENDMIPSDCVFLGSALPKGHCFIDKANLNGETKLEVMSCHPATKAYCDKPEKMSKMNFELVYEAPNKRFDSLRGMIKIDGQEVAVDGKSLLMRETNLKNCAFIYGLVVYTGNDTKIQVSNSEGEKAKVKVSWIMRQVNVYLRYMLLLQLVLCAGGAVGAATWAKANKGAWYLDLGDEDIDLLGFYAFFTWFILLSQMVPISLIVSAEMVKFVMSMFIQWDYTLYYPDINKPTKCNSSTIHEDLGLIDYIFSDKTGTLTQNKMEFRYLMLNCGDWGSKETEIAKSVQRRKAELESGNEPAPATPWTTLSAPLHADSDSPYRGDRCERSCLKGLWADDPPKRDVELDDAAANKFSNRERTELLLALWGPPGEGESLAANKKKKKMLKTYMRHCALSNTVKSYMDEGVLKFQAESAEELAMVQFAESIGFVKARSNPTVLEIQTYKPSMEKSEVITEKYAHVATFGFTSKRARVTVVLQNQESGTYMVLHKGQDTVVLPLTTNDDGNDDLLTIELSSLSTNGLRTLVCGHADHPTGWWDQYSKQYHRAVKMEVTPASEGHSDNKCTPVECVHCVQHDLFQKIEQEADLKFLGVVGMEDQLQLLVPEAIKDFLRAGIRVWMITGDKLETAKNIGLACNLIDPDMSPQVRVGDTLEEVASAFSNARLIEVTGAWSGLVNSRSELTRLFDSLDQSAPWTRRSWSHASLRLSAT
jgi:phospholipid-transporting ATPase